MVDPEGLRPDSLTAAYMAAAAYDLGTVEGWTLESWEKMKNGLQYAIYSRTAQDEKEYVFATAGTQFSIKDVAEDVLQLFGNSSQYNVSIKKAKAFVKNHPNSEITFVGHSLGGGLASANALETGKDAITFNAAGLSKTTKQKLGLSGKTAHIDAYIVNGEAVDYYQQKIGISAEGIKHYLPAYYLPVNLCRINTALRLKNHCISSLIEKLR